MKNLRLGKYIIDYVLTRISIKDLYKDKIEIAVLCEDNARISSLIEKRNNDLKTTKEMYKTLIKEHRRK